MAQLPPGYNDQDDTARGAGKSVGLARLKGLGRFGGRRLDAATLRQLQKVAPGGLRIIRPGDMQTMDLVPNRLTVTVDERDIIKRLAFG